MGYELSWLLMTEISPEKNLVGPTLTHKVQKKFIESINSGNFRGSLIFWHFQTQKKKMNLTPDDWTCVS